MEPKKTSAIYSSLFFLSFILAVVMLVTDKNLQTGFNCSPTTDSNCVLIGGYFLHWWAVVAAAVASVLGGILLVTVGTRRAILGGIVGSGLLTLIFLGDIATYAQVGFSSASDMANYLFGVTYYGGDIRYLYDALLAVYIVTFIVGWIALRAARPGKPAPPPTGL